MKAISRANQMHMMCCMDTMCMASVVCVQEKCFSLNRQNRKSRMWR